MFENLEIPIETLRTLEFSVKKPRQQKRTTQKEALLTVNQTTEEDERSNEQ